MIINTAILRAMLASTCLISIGLCEARDYQVARLRNVQNDDFARVSELEALKDTLHEIQDVIPFNERFTSTGKRDPKRKPKSSNGNKNGTDQDDDDSGVGKVDISMPLSIGAGLVIVTMLLQY
ncbi:uncharacterized protein F4807DRAFT_171908 [Annulohypoxylon truncatum]|uniref:uncharacterized protein n=1 Tax=Annulohypoxylon truncatum TaxID=327061 RepID=UPI0020077746|nr:uncharacterized protein F4807DRAFT_171908 [Annulohypoxylon truncatum]KAI1207582.1 hypothetical protein F4807DRAFT_171908 [Annulohypoxylon truncatum]